MDPGSLIWVIPVHITHLFRRKTSAGGARPILDLVEQARDEGLDVTFDMFPYRYGGTRILITFPHWPMMVVPTS